MASKSKRGKGKAKGCKIVLVKRKRRLVRADELRLTRAPLVHVSRRLPDPMPGGRAEYVAHWVPRMVAL